MRTLESLISMSIEQDHAGESNNTGVPSEDAEKSESIGDTTAEPCPPSGSSEWIQGWRLSAIAVGTCVAIGMTQADSTIASTAILVITDDLGGFDKSSWVFTAYLITYSGFPIILGHVSDIIGRKLVFLASLAMFTIFSGACGASQTLLQLIMFRWIQGLGASGVLSIGTMYGFELRPPDKWPAYSALISLSVVISLAVAPVIGAALTQIGQWRWTFLINTPLGATSFLLLMSGMPKTLPREPASYTTNGPWRYRNFQNIDIPGVLALVGSSAVLTAALQQAAEGISFAAPTVVPLLVLAPILASVFLFWQWYSSRARRRFVADPIISWSLLSNRIFIGVLANAFLSGSIITVSIVQIPQRFVIVNGLSTVEAGIRLMPFAAVMAFTSVIVSIVLTKSKIPVLYWLLLGGLLQITGTAGFARSSTDIAIEPSQYGFQVLAGVGVGIFNVALLLLTPHIVEKKYLAVTNGAINQFRLLGGTFGLSIVVSVSNSRLRNDLQSVLTLSQVSMLLSRTEVIRELPEPTQIVIRRMFGDNYNLQMMILIGIAAANIPATLLQWKKTPVVFHK